jgi:hypothetical protein
MAEHELSVIAGALARSLKPKGLPPQDSLAKRWRLPVPAPSARGALPDVIPLLDGWIRVLERDVAKQEAPRAR